MDVICIESVNAIFSLARIRASEIFSVFMGDINTTEIILDRDDASFIQANYIGNLPVIVMKENRTGCFYINATKFCTSQDPPKRYSNWLKNQYSIDMIDHLARISTDAATVSPSGLGNVLNGTYIHLDLFPHLASWISPKIAIQVSTIVNRIYREEYNRYSLN